MKAKGASIATSLVDRKVKAKYAHLWFGRDPHDYQWMADGAPIPTDLGTVRAVYQDKDRDLKMLVESGTGEVREFYAENIALVPV